MVDLVFPCGLVEGVGCGVEGVPCMKMTTGRSPGARAVAWRGPIEHTRLSGFWWLDVMVQVSGFRVQGSGFRVQGSGFRVQGSGFRVQGLGYPFIRFLVA